MKKILLLSDTHGVLFPKIEKFAMEVDEVWHAGDIGDVKVLERLNPICPIRAVWGNIDGGDIREMVTKHALFEVEGCKVLMTHIAGSFGSYSKEVKDLLVVHQPRILVCGHSHILKVAYDQRNKTLYMNPGAAGNHGFHQMITLLRFDLDEGKPKNLHVIELGKRGELKLDQSQ